MKHISFTLSILLSLSAFANFKALPNKGAFNAPESVLVDTWRDQIYVSNVAGEKGEGFISKLNLSGEVIEEKWVAKGLNGPKGMGVCSGKVFVADIDRVKVISIKEAKVVDEIPVTGAKMLNDIAIDYNTGTLYVSDSRGSSIHMINIKTKEQEKFIQLDELETPNGLHVNNGKLYVAGWGLRKEENTWETTRNGSFYSIDLITKEREDLSIDLGNLDGVEVDPNNENLIYITDWVAGKLYAYNRATEKVISVSEYLEIPGAADIGIFDNNGVTEVFIPSMSQNEIILYQN